MATGASGQVVSQQEYDPCMWGRVRSGGITHTTLNYTGQRLDGIGLRITCRTRCWLAPG